MARYDLGLSDEDFEECTPAMFQALCKRRNIRIKYERYANAQTAAAVYNTSRSKADDPVIHPFDFIRDEESSHKKEELEKVQRFIKRVIGNMPPSTPREKLLEIRAKVIKDVQAFGRSDAESLFDQAWPNLKPKKE